MNRTSTCMLTAALLAVAADGLAAQADMQSPSVQAKRGQSSAQQARDTDFCQVMARKRTGVDPTVLAANSTPLQEGKGLTSTPIDQPSMAMGSSGAGATGAGTGEQGAGSQAGSAAMGSSGTAGTTGASSMEGQPATGTATSGVSGNMGSTAASGNMGATGASGSMGSTAGSGSAGSSGAAGSMGSGGGQQLATVTAEDYNAAFSKCMSGRGYVVGSNQ